MKSSIKIILITLCILAIAGCGNKPPSLENRAQDANNQSTTNVTKSYTGTIESFGVDIYKDGTHKIKTTDGTAIVIQSSTINLTNYIDKKVTITGSMKKLIDNKSEVFTVTKIKTEGVYSEGKTTEYKNEKLGFELKYADIWEITEDSEAITLSSSGADWVTVDISNDVSKTLDEFTKAKESKEGTAVTISSQRSLRYTDTDKIKVYIPNITKKKIYKITFNDKGTDKEVHKKLFYTLLDSFKLIASKSASGEKCGGKEALTCPEDYRCELKDGEEDAEGICVAVAGSKADCPYTATPANCTNYKAKSFNKDSCPTSYECLDVKSDTTKDTTTSDSKSNETTSGTDSTSDTTTTAKTDTTTTTDTDKADTSSETKEEVVIAPKAGMAAYTNTRKSFSMEYPKNWYYRAFGAIDSTIESMGFGGKELESMADATISVTIISKSASSKKEMKGSRYIATVSRDEKSHFVINGPLGMKDAVDKMADSIKLETSE